VSEAGTVATETSVLDGGSPRDIEGQTDEIKYASEFLLV
jgi:hypothetical protein